MTRVRLFSILTFGFALFLFSVSGNATVLAPGAVFPSTVAPDVFVHNGGVGYGVVQAGGDTGVQAFSFAGNTGTLEQVVTLDPTTGFLDFLTEFKVTAGMVEHLTNADFFRAGYGVVGFPDVGYDTTDCLLLIGCAVGPSVIAPTTVNTDNGHVISFNFVTPGVAVTAGDESFLLVVKTNASTFSAGSVGLIDGGGATLAGFQPTPEPAGVGLLLGGLFAVGLFLARRFQVAKS